MSELLDIDGSEFIEEPTVTKQEVEDLLLGGMLKKPMKVPKKKFKKDTPANNTNKDVLDSELALVSGEIADTLMIDGAQDRSPMINPLENDRVLESLSSQESTNQVLNSVMKEIAEEAAYIKAWRSENWGANIDTSDATFKRVKMLQELVKILTEKERLKKENAVGKVDFYSDNFQDVFKYFLEIINKVAVQVNIPSQFRDVFFTQLSKEYEGFEKKAEKIYYGKTR